MEQTCLSAVRFQIPKFYKTEVNPQPAASSIWNLGFKNLGFFISTFGIWKLKIWNFNIKYYIQQY
jgi:hypothetical protein